MLVMSWNIYRRTIDDLVKPAGRQNNNSLWLAVPHNLDRSLQHITNVRGLDFFFGSLTCRFEIAQSVHPIIYLISNNNIGYLVCIP